MKIPLMYKLSAKIYTFSRFVHVLPQDNRDCYGFLYSHHTLGNSSITFIKSFNDFTALKLILVYNIQLKSTKHETYS